MFNESNLTWSTLENRVTLYSQKTKQREQFVKILFGSGAQKSLKTLKTTDISKINNILNFPIHSHSHNVHNIPAKTLPPNKLTTDLIINR